MVTVVVVWSLGMLIAAATEAIWAEVPDTGRAGNRALRDAHTAASRCRYL